MGAVGVLVGGVVAGGVVTTEEVVEPVTLELPLVVDTPGPLRQEVSPSCIA